MNTFGRSVAAWTLAVGSVFGAQAQTVEDAFRDFTGCDAGFFRGLNRDRPTWAALAPLETRGDLSWIKVANRHVESGNQVVFANPLKVAGLDVLSYFDEASDLGSMGLYYYWGFKVTGGVEDAVRALKPLVYQSGRLRSSGSGVFARSEVKVLGSRWLPISTPGGTAAGLSKTERVLIFEDDEKQKGVTRVSCSLQGGISPAILAEIRPDIDPADYPKQLSPTLFDDVGVPPTVKKSLDAARANKDIWTPKFKRLSYTVVSKSPGRSKDGGWTVEMDVTPDGLLNVKETYDPAFNVQRLMFGGWVQLKSRMNGLSDGRVYLTTDLDLTLPSSLAPGTVFQLDARGADQPPQPGEVSRSLAVRCKVTEATNASDVFPAIPGRAIGLSCASGENGEDLDERVFLEDLGLVVTLGSVSKLTGSSTSKIVQFDLQR